jgi:hypothetical protein
VARVGGEGVGERTAGKEQLAGPKKRGGQGSVSRVGAGRRSVVCRVGGEDISVGAAGKD